MMEISNELLEQAREVLANKPEKSRMDNINYLKMKLGIGRIKAHCILEAIQEVSRG